MIETIWQIEGGALDREARVRPLIEQVVGMPGFEPGRYDLNQKEQWRRFDLDRAVVDALTQRTQLVRIAGPEGASVAMLAMGKHGEQPTAIVRLADPPGLEDLVAGWEPVFEEAPVFAAAITSEAWREALESAGLEYGDEAIVSSMVRGWRNGREPDGLDAIDGEPFESTPVRVERRSGFVVLWLGSDARLAGPDHRRALEAVDAKL